MRLLYGLAVHGQEASAIHFIGEEMLRILIRQWLQLLEEGYLLVYPDFHSGRTTSVDL